MHDPSAIRALGARNLARRLFSLLAVAVAAASCAHSPAQGPRPLRVSRRPAASPPPSLSGVYDWAAQTQDRYGDAHFEQEEWHLEQHGPLIRGFYDRAITYVSGDGRPYRCNQKLRFTRVTRIDVVGTIAGSKLTLRETAFRAQPSPCDDGGRSLVAYTGQSHPDALTLATARGLEQRLVRRPSRPRAEPSAVPERDLFERATDVPERNAPIDGSWTSELQTHDPNGDQRIELEQWQLVETETGLTGHYRSLVTHVRRTGVYACNGRDRYQTQTRYDVQGQRSGDRFTLVETTYRATPSPCDNGARRLDSYHGVVVSEGTGAALVLSWGRSTQLLRRRPPSP